MCTPLNRCCCFDLRTGTLIIGFVDLMLGIICVLSATFKLLGGSLDESISIAFGIAALLVEIVASIALIIGVRKVSS